MLLSTLDRTLGGSKSAMRMRAPPGIISSGSAQALFCEMVKQRVVLTGVARKRGQVLDDARLKFFFEQGNQFFANARAHFGGVAIGGVLAPGLLSRFEVQT